ncbi:hypothetical protein [Pseudonocardia alni]|uniref:hypothetical protein n=1 Tax=Pseudonocardia alni TaxID=33907 RepID=UPI0033E65FFB
MVSTEVFTVNQAAMNARLEGLTQKDAALEQKIDRTEEHRRSDRRTTITSLFSAGIAILLAVSGWVVTALNNTPVP